VEHPTITEVEELVQATTTTIVTAAITVTGEVEEAERLAVAEERLAVAEELPRVNRLVAEMAKESAVSVTRTLAAPAQTITATQMFQALLPSIYALTRPTGSSNNAIKTCPLPTNPRHLFVEVHRLQTQWQHHRTISQDDLRCSLRL